MRRVQLRDLSIAGMYIHSSLTWRAQSGSRASRRSTLPPPTPTRAAGLYFTKKSHEFSIKNGDLCIKNDEILQFLRPAPRRRENTGARDLSIKRSINQEIYQSPPQLIEQGRVRAIACFSCFK